MAGKPTVAYPEKNFLLARKADDLSEPEILDLFVEPGGVLSEIVGTKQHLIIQGGRGSGKTMTLRRLSHSIAPPTLDYQFLGVYVCLDINQCSPFTSENIGRSNGAVFESYLSGV